MHDGLLTGARSVWVALVSLALLVVTGCASHPEGEAAAKPSANGHQELLVGYTLLADTLSDESQLHLLGLFKTLTLDAPPADADAFMKTLDAASQRRATELEGLRRLAPDVSGKPSKPSPIGDAINAVAKELGSDEMKDRDGPFEVRFLLLQAQATRMVTAISIATARFEPNRQRKQWLMSVAAEYEGYRNDMIALVEKKFGPKRKAR